MHICIDFCVIFDHISIDADNIFKASEKGDVARVRALVASGKSTNSRDNVRRRGEYIAVHCTVIRGLSVLFSLTPFLCCRNNSVICQVHPSIVCIRRDVPKFPSFNLQNENSVGEKRRIRSSRITLLDNSLRKHDAVMMSK
jgi:hypothetical protein